MADLFPQSPLTPEAAWRSADIRWQLQKADVMSLPSAHEKDAYLREQIDDEELRKLRKNYPNSKWADLADWDMLDNKVCGDWQGSTKCPEKEAEMYEKYAQEHPDSPRGPGSALQRGLPPGRAEQHLQRQWRRQKSRRGQGQSRNHSRYHCYQISPIGLCRPRRQSGIPVAGINSHLRHRSPIDLGAGGPLNDYILSVLLGIVEGLTEFLPVSSTAHLRLVEALLHVDLASPYWKMYTVVIQLGAIIALVVLFTGRILEFFRTFPQGENGDRTVLTHPIR